MLRLMRVGRILICVYNTSNDCLLLLLSVGGAVEGGSRLHGAASAADARGRRAASGPKTYQRVKNLHQEGKHGRAVNLQADPRRRPTRLQHRAWWETGHRVCWRDVSSKEPFEDPGTHTSSAVQVPGRRFGSESTEETSEDSGTTCEHSGAGNECDAITELSEGTSEEPGTTR